MYVIQCNDEFYLQNDGFPACWGTDKKSAHSFERSGDAFAFAEKHWAPVWIASNIKVVHKFHVTGAEAYRMVREGNFRPLTKDTKDEWDMFAGRESKDPQIAEVGEYLVVLDGAGVLIHHDEDQYGGQMFQLALVPQD